jgi:hypothetical protein
MSLARVVQSARASTGGDDMSKKINVLFCALALLTAMPTAGFTQRGLEASIELGDVGPAFTVARLLVAKDVSDREPVGAATEFSTADTSHLFAFVEIENPNAEPGEVTVTWIDLASGEARRSYVLEIGPHKRWRTWARAAAPKQAGSWAVVATDADGAEIARTQFAMLP